MIILTSLVCNFHAEIRDQMLTREKILTSERRKHLGGEIQGLQEYYVQFLRDSHQERSIKKFEGEVSYT